MVCGWFVFFEQKTAYEMRISDWSSDVCSSDLHVFQRMTDPVACGDFRQRLAELCGLRGELGIGSDKNIDLVFDGLFEILAAYFQCVRVNAIGNDEDLASRRIGTQPGQDAKDRKRVV